MAARISQVTIRRGKKRERERREELGLYQRIEGQRGRLEPLNLFGSQDLIVPSGKYLLLSGTSFRAHNKMNNSREGRPARELAATIKRDDI